MKNPVRILFCDTKLVFFLWKFVWFICMVLELSRIVSIFKVFFIFDYTITLNVHISTSLPKLMNMLNGIFLHLIWWIQNENCILDSKIMNFREFYWSTGTYSWRSHKVLNRRKGWHHKVTYTNKNWIQVYKKSIINK